MSGTVRVLVSQHRYQLVRRLQAEQREQIKQAIRQSLPTINTTPTQEIYHLTHILPLYNIHYFQPELTTMLQHLTNCAQNHEFTTYLTSSQLLPSLIDTILGELSRKPYLQAPLLAQQLVHLVAHLAPHYPSKTLLNIHTTHLLYALQRYPKNTAILLQLYTLTRHTTLTHSPHLDLTHSPHLDHSQLIEALLQAYLLSAYQQDTTPQALELVAVVLLGSNKRQQILGKPICQQSLQAGLVACLQGAYWWLLEPVLSVLVMRQELVSRRQGEVLVELLGLCLDGVRRGEGRVCGLGKLLGLLYEQVLLDEQELWRVGAEFVELRGEVEGALEGDLI